MTAPTGTAAVYSHWGIASASDTVSSARSARICSQPYQTRTSMLPTVSTTVVTAHSRRSGRGSRSRKIVKPMWAERRKAGEIVQAEGLAQVSDSGALEAACRKVVDANPDEAARFRAGNAKLIGFFVGQVMKETGGKDNPKSVNEILKRLLG